MSRDRWRAGFSVPPSALSAELPRLDLGTGFLRTQRKQINTAQETLDLQLLKNTSNTERGILWHQREICIEGNLLDNRSR